MFQNGDNIIPAAVDPALRRAKTSSVSQTNQEIPADIPSQHINPSKTVTKANFSYEIKGENSQFVEITLRPGQAITGEINALMYFDTGINMKMRMSSSLDSEQTGFLNKLLGLGKAAVTGQKLFMMTFTNTTQKELKIAFSMPYSGMIVPIEVGAVGGELYCQNDSFLCAATDLRISSVMPREVGSNFLNATNSIQKIQGNGTLFLFCGGSVMERKLKPGDVLNVSSGTELAMQPGIIFKNKTIRNVGITGQGYMLTEISGAGSIWLQSVPYSRAKANIINNISLLFGIKRKKTNFVWGKK